MNKSELIKAIAVEAGMTQGDSKKVLEAFIATVSQSLKEGDKVILIGFGTFSTSVRKARTGRNPQTGKPLEIKAKKMVNFKVGAELSSSIQ